MNKDFVRVQTLLRDLEHTVPSHVSPYLHLEYGRWWRSAFVWEESFPSKPAARRNAEQELAALYQQAEQKFHTYTDGHTPDGFLLRSKAEYDRRLSDLREAVGCCRTEATAPIVNRIGLLLVSDHLFQELDQIYAELCASYSLPGLEHYCQHIVYERNDPSESEEGFLWLVSKALMRWGYDLMPAIQQLEADAQERLESIHQSFTAQASISVRKHIIAPVQAKLPILRELLNRAA